MTASRRRLLEQVGGGITLSLAGCINTSRSDLPGELSSEWVGETTTEYDENHHAMTTATVDGQPLVCLPRNDLDGAQTCGVVTLDANGAVLWSDTLPPEHCNPHAVGDVGVGDLTGDDRSEFLVATESEGVVAYDAATGDETFRQKLLESISYSAPIVANLTDDDTPELAIVDFAGNFSVVRPDGSVVWTEAEELEQPVYVTPLVADFTGDGRANVAVHHGRDPSEVVCFDGDGEIVWRSEQGYPSLTWTLADRDTGPALVTSRGNTVVLLDGADGHQHWSTTVGDDLREVRLGEADHRHIYVGGPDGTVRALDIHDGTVQWKKQMTEDSVRMPPPAVGAVTGSETRNVVAATYNGTIAVFDAESGDEFARRQLDTGFYTQPRTVDLTGDGRDEIILLNGDARVSAFSYEAESG